MCLTRLDPILNNNSQHLTQLQHSISNNYRKKLQLLLETMKEVATNQHYIKY